MRTTPFPLEALDAASPLDAVLTRHWRETLTPDVVRSAEEALHELLEARCALVLGPAVLVDPTPPAVSDTCAAVVLETRSATTARVVVELEARLAGALVDRVLGGAGVAAATTGPGAIADLGRGAVAYLAARVLDAVAGPEWRVETVLTSRAACDVALGEGRRVVSEGRLDVTFDAGPLRILVPEATLRACAARAADAPRPGVPADSELTLCAEVARGHLPVREIAALEPGDVVVLDESFGTFEAGEYAGLAYVHALGVRRLGLWCQAEPTGLRRSDRPIERGAGTEGRVMDELRMGDVERLAGDAPVELAIEVGRFQMSLADLSSLGVGEIVATGAPVGARVTLRAGAHAVARGELVTVDGELGIRVAELCTRGPSHAAR